jgi:MAE_28990/MAE_18760-like HEPN
MSWQQDLENELDWRSEELAVLKLQAGRAANGSLLQRATLRALIAMLYAHYEGFCKTAIRLYLQEIRTLGVRREECVEKLRMFSLQKAIRELKAYTNEECWDFITSSFNHLMQEVMDYELNRESEIVLEGDSNLYPRLLRANLQRVCLPYGEVDAHEQLLKSLVGRRNDIAHGKKLVIADLATYELHERAVLDVIYGLAYAIIDALEHRRYLRPVVYEG